MTDDESLFLNRIKDLARACYTQNRYSFSNFLSMEEQSFILTHQSEINYVDYDFYGGCDGCERQMIRFGSERMLMFVEKYPITILLIEPLMEKFSDELTHRDYLGALMNLGIQRNVLGDIVRKEKSAYLFCHNDVSEFIKNELTRVKHTAVIIKEVDCIENTIIRQLEEYEILVSSPRADAVVAAICKLSRGKACDLFREKRVFLNNRICENNSYILKPGNVLSIRGVGKYIYDGEGGRTRKDRVYIKLKRYI